ncbi:MAG: SRPBCC family protein [Acidobacteriota bacterium]|nr:MAG: SRPBCC family protein [Acidobacteriota bacterium]
MTKEIEINPDLDLVLERVIDVPRELVWKAWTDVEQLKRWFVPKPWSVADCRIDIRPGGEFTTVMRSPEGEEFPSSGCFLEVVENERLVFTSALLPGFRPTPKVSGDHELPFTAFILLEPEGVGTRYRAILIHGDPQSKKTHEDMGFESGWGAALDQMVEMISSEQ